MMLIRVALGVTTVTVPVVAPIGTVAVIAVPVWLTVNAARTPPKVTLVDPLRPFPRIIVVAPTWPELA